MSERTHPSNPLALAVLALLFERPMHPYEMGVLLRQRHKEESIKFRYGSLYTVIEYLLQREFIVARETARDGRRPERTVYELTAAGREELRSWMADLIAEPVKEYQQFEAALCLMPVLPPDEVLALLRRRLEHFEGHGPAQVVVVREEDRSHPAGAEFVPDDVRTKSEAFELPGQEQFGLKPSQEPVFDQHRRGPHGVRG